MADFGDGVLEAMVETAAFILRGGRAENTESIFFRMLLQADKASALRNAIDCLKEARPCAATFVTKTDAFGLLPSAPFVYWVSGSTIRTLSKRGPLEGGMAKVRVGLQTGEDARFLRLIWEVPDPPSEEASVTATRSKPTSSSR
jgi:hypothetical protein